MASTRSQGKDPRQARASIDIRVRVQPMASSNQIVGFRDDVLQVRLTAPPERGKANRALVDLLANSLGVARSRVSILSGYTSRNKRVFIDGVSLADLHRHLTPTGPE